MPDYSLAVKAGLVKEPKEVDAYVLVNGGRQGAINWMRDNKWEYGFDDEAINIVEEDERSTRLIRVVCREASKGKPRHFTVLRKRLWHKGILERQPGRPNSD